MYEDYSAQKNYATNNGMQVMSPFDKLAAAVELLNEVGKFSDLITDRLTGPVPPAPVAGAANLDIVSNGGLLSSMESHARSIKAITETIRANLQRIESRL